ncbi:MAG: hypothetical protein WC641_03890 [Patescibacteria group bacterium]
MKNGHLFKHAALVGVFAVLLYAACLLWRFTMTDPAVIQFHLLALKTALPGFNGFDAASLILGGIMSFVYGFVISVVFHALHGNWDCGMKK